MHLVDKGTAKECCPVIRSNHDCQVVIYACPSWLATFNSVTILQPQWVPWPLLSLSSTETRLGIK